MTLDDEMPPPPPGCVQGATLGDKPINALKDYPTPEDAVQVCCVLVGDWPGASEEDREKCPDIGAHYVQCLYNMVSRYAPPNTNWRFTCFTDRQEIKGVPCRPIPPGIWTWFNKLYLFSSEAFPLNSRVLFFDLDTVIKGSLEPLFNLPLDKMVLLRDQWMYKYLIPASGIMSWRATPATERIWTDYIPLIGKRPPYTHPSGKQYDQKYQLSWEIRSDEHWLYRYLLPDKWAPLQDLVSGIYSYKHNVLGLGLHGRKAERLTPTALESARIIFFHGRPRPHAVAAPWNPISRLFYPPRQINVC